jgi:Protein of unknown function (DUF1375)
VPHPLSGVEITLGVFAWLDLPFSLVCDTLTLPWTVTAEVKHLVDSFDKPERESPPAAAPLDGPAPSPR